MTIGIIGGTGLLGRGLAARLARSGTEVVLSSRELDRARTAVAGLGHDAGSVMAGDHAMAAACDIVVLAVPFDAVDDLVAWQEALAGKVLISPVNQIAVHNGQRVPAMTAGESSAQYIQRRFPDSEVTTAFNHLPARVVADPSEELDADVIVCASSPHAFRQTSAVVERIEGLRPVYGGTLDLAHAVEAFTAVIINVNVREKQRASLCLAGQGCA